ncbi:MAG TPA: C4-dicarboxylate ABC transporter substrate-binding protein [Candidatus Atribacteria bacterium]|nr:C4-dicarboxylate ABC transporter substrate-binding protein [Candidatus Atribacteria bacterium]
MKRHLNLFKIMLTVLILVLFSLSVTAKTIHEWDLPTAWAATNYQSVCLKIFADEVYKRTDGQVKINIHYGGALGYKGPEMLSVVRDGLVPIGDILKNAQTGEEKFFGITSLPFLAPGVVDLRMLEFFTRPIEDEILEKHNQKMLYQVPWPSRNVYTKKRIDTLEDLKGLKIRTVSKEDTDLFTLLGASPIQMPWGEVVTSLATGVIDGVATSSASGVDGKFWEFTGYASRWNWHSSEDMVNVNLDAWNRLSPELQEIIEKTAHELEPQFWKIAVEENIEKEKILIEKGIEVYDPNPELLEIFKKLSRKIWNDHMNEVPESVQVIEDYLIIMEY